MRDEVWLVYYHDAHSFEPELHVVCKTSESAQQYISDNTQPEIFDSQNWIVEKHQVY